MEARSKQLFENDANHITLEFRVPFSLKSSFVFTCLIVLFGTWSSAIAQTSASPPPVTLSTDQDRQNMMDQLGIQALRPGYSGNEKASNHANYDKAKADPFLNIPDPLVLNNGQRVTTAEMWWNLRPALSVKSVNVPSRLFLYCRLVVPGGAPSIRVPLRTNSIQTSLS
jgi:hypothetical protein